jgi:type I restriction enzyme S subunit
MPTSDREVLTIGQLIDEGRATLQTGPFGSQLHASDYVPSGTAVIPTEAIGRRSIRDDVVLPQVSEVTAARLSRHALQKGDILFARRGVQATGLSAIVSGRHSGALCGTGAIRLRFSSSDVDPTYVSFLLNTPRSVEWIKAHAVGGVMPNVNESVLRLLPIELPSIDVQRNIAALLGSLDDKIGLNSDVNAKLETLATGLYRSWFVDFEPVVAKLEGKTPIGVPAEAINLFPSHFEDSDLGPIPEGWLAGRLGDRFEIAMGQSPPGSTYNEAGEGLPFYQGRTDFRFRFPSRRVYCTAPTRFADPGDTLVSVRAPVGDANMASGRVPSAVALLRSDIRTIDHRSRITRFGHCGTSLTSSNLKAPSSAPLAATTSAGSGSHIPRLPSLRRLRGSLRRWMQSSNRMNASVAYSPNFATRWSVRSSQVR